MKITKVDSCKSKPKLTFKDISIGVAFRRIEFDNIFYIKTGVDTAICVNKGDSSFRRSVEVEYLGEIEKMEICEITWMDKKD